MPKKVVSVDQAAEEFKQNIDKFVADYKQKNLANSEQYPLELPADNSGLWSEFMLEFHLNQ